MMRYLLPCFYAFLCCLAFSFVFELRNWRYILAASFTGAVSWAVFLAAGSGTIAYFLATIAVAGLAELFALQLRDDCQARTLQSDGSYVRVRGEAQLNSQEYFYDWACERAGKAP